MTQAPENNEQGRRQGGQRFSSFIPPLGIFLFALLVRTVYLLTIADHPFFRAPVVDAETYLAQAQRIAQGQLLDRESFWQPPLYPYALGFALWLFGENHFLLHFLHAFLGAINCLLIFYLGRRLSGRGPAVLAAFFAAGYGPILYFEGDYAAPVAICFLDLLLLLCLIRFRKHPGFLNSALCGAGFGLSALARPDILLFFPLAILWLAFYLRHRLDRKGLALRLSLLAAVTGLVIFPATLHNWMVSREFALISTNGGANFYLGNNRHWRETVALRPGLAWDELMARPFRAGHLTPAARSRYFFRAAFSDLGENPAAFLGRLAVKAGQFFYGHEYLRNVDLYFFREHSWLLRVLVWEKGIAFPYGLLSPLAILGLGLFLLSRDPDQRLALIFAAAQASAVALFFVASRYRMPVIPVFLISASSLLFQAGAWLRQKAGGKALFIFAAALTIACNQGINKAPRMSDEEAHLRLGESLARLHQDDKALAEFQTALRLAPHSPDVHHLLGIHLLRLNQTEEAKKHFLYLISSDSRPATMITAHAARYLGDLELSAGRLTEAEVWYRRSLAAYPFLGNARVGLAQIYSRRGELEKAEAELLFMTRVTPRDARLFEELARLELRRGRLQSARRYRQQAERLK